MKPTKSLLIAIALTALPGASYAQSGGIYYDRYAQSYTTPSANYAPAPQMIQPAYPGYPVFQAAAPQVTNPYQPVNPYQAYNAVRASQGSYVPAAPAIGTARHAPKAIQSTRWSQTVYPQTGWEGSTAVARYSNPQPLQAVAASYSPAQTPKSYTHIGDITQALTQAHQTAPAPSWQGQTTQYQTTRYQPVQIQPTQIQKASYQQIQYQPASYPVPYYQGQRQTAQSQPATPNYGYLPAPSAQLLAGMQGSNWAAMQDAYMQALEARRASIAMQNRIPLY